MHEKIPNILFTEIVMRLEKRKLYAPYQAASTFVKREENPRLYGKLKRKMNYFATSRDGDISSNPDNAVLDPVSLRPKKRLNSRGYFEVVVKGDYVAWYGETWQSQLTEQEINDLLLERRGLEERLLSVLDRYSKAKSPDQTVDEGNGEGTGDQSLEKKWRPKQIFVAAMVALGLLGAALEISVEDVSYPKSSIQYNSQLPEEFLYFDGIEGSPYKEIKKEVDWPNFLP